MATIAYFLTNTTYGTWLPGDQRGSADDEHHVYGTAYAPADAERERANRSRMTQDPVIFDNKARAIVHATIEEVCRFRGWKLHAVNVRTNHFHAVVTAPDLPDKVLSDFKAWGTRRLREAGWIADGLRVWTRRGSTRKLFSENGFLGAVHYTLHEQDNPRRFEGEPEGGGS